MADELVLYTNPRSRGRIARWMLEEVGQPYRTEILDFATTMKAPAYLAINPMGKVPAAAPWRCGGDRNGRHLRLSRRRVSADRAGAAARRPAARPLLPVDVLHRRTDGGGDQQQGAGFRGAARTRGHDGLRQLRSGDEGARRRGVACRLPGRREVYARRMSMSARTSDLA